MTECVRRQRGSARQPASHCTAQCEAVFLSKLAPMPTEMGALLAAAERYIWQMYKQPPRVCQQAPEGAVSLLPQFFKDLTAAVICM